jgi:hypothetical protein
LITFEAPIIYDAFDFSNYPTILAKAWRVVVGNTVPGTIIKQIGVMYSAPGTPAY